MEAKEKAKELFDKYFDMKWQSYNKKTTSIKSMTKSSAKQCALIAVKEIIKYQDSLIGMLDTNDGTNPMFWENVKQEINKL